MEHKQSQLLNTDEHGPITADSFACGSSKKQNCRIRKITQN
jgi:hypothetical protein